MNKKKIKNKNTIIYRGREVNPFLRAKIYYVLNPLIAFLPLFIMVIIQRDVYFSSKETFISNMLGLSMCGMFCAVIASKKVGILKGCWGFIFFTAICFALRYILNELLLISFCATLGMIISTVWGQKKSDKWARLAHVTDESDIQAQKNAQVLHQYNDEITRGRG